MENKAPSNLTSDPLILLTGCINPDGMSYTKLQNKETRKSHYLEAINFYLMKTTSKVLFVENSGTDISNEFENGAYKERLEILTFYGNNYDKHLGKGYGEMLILKYAFENSAFISQCDTVCKITGRYKVLNIKQILQHFEGSKCDVMVDLLHQMRYSDSRIFCAKNFFFTNYLFQIEKEINDIKGYYFEHSLKDAVLHAIIDDRSYLPFKYKPRIVGTSGTDNMNYNHSFWNWIRMYKKQKDNFKYFTSSPDNYLKRLGIMMKSYRLYLIGSFSCSRLPDLTAAINMFQLPFLHMALME